MSTSGIEKLGITKPISPKEKISSKKKSSDSSNGSGKISDSANISSEGKQLNEAFSILKSVKNQAAANPGAAVKSHKNFNLKSLGSLFENNSFDIENVLKGITKEIFSNADAAVKVHNNISATEVAKFIS